MKVVIFGATGSVGSECLQQCLEAGHEVTVLVRSADKLPARLQKKITVVEGNGLKFDDVDRTISADTDRILFAIGVDKHSPEDLCTDVTRHILKVMTAKGVKRLVWCGGGSTLVEEDDITFGARFVECFSRLFMSLRHNDKTHQYHLLKDSMHIDWLGVRPLQMKAGERREVYRMGFDTFSGMSSISFADCAHAMLGLMEGDTWLRKAPIIQY